MPDKTYAKFILNNETYLDLTGDTVDSSSLLSGYTAHDRSGAPITGSFDPSVYVLKAGDTMTGPLILSGAPTENLHAATKKYVDDTAANYVTLTTDQDITGTKTFIGQKKILFKQSGTNDKLGFTLYKSDSTEQGYLEYNPSNKVDNAPLFTLGNYASSSSGICQVGFRRYSSVTGASGAYNLLTPLIADAKTPFSLTTTYTNFYLPLGFKINSTTNILTAKSGLVDLSGQWLPLSGGTISGNLKISGTIQVSTASGESVKFLTQDFRIEQVGAGIGASKEVVLKLGNSYNTTSVNSSYGRLRIFGSNQYSSSILVDSSNSLTDNRNLYLPDKTGTIAITDDLNSYVLKSGDTMTGALTLSGAPTSDLHAVTKKYVDDNVGVVKQETGGTAGNAYRVLFSHSSNDNTETNSVYKDSNFTFTPAGGNSILNVSGSGDTSSISRGTITLGNAIPNGSVGNSYGSIQIYGYETYYYNITGFNTANPLTANRDFVLPNNSGTIAITDDLNNYVPKSGGTITGGYLIIEDTSLTSGSASAYLALGNSTSLSSAGSSFGVLHLYGTGIYKSSVRTTTLTDNRLLYLPDKDGTLAVTDDLYSQNLYSQNLISKDMFIQGSLSGSAGADTVGLGRLRSIYIPVKSSTTYSLSTGSTAQIYEIHEFNSSKTFIQYTAKNAVSTSITTTSTTKFIKILVRYTNDSYIPLSALENVQMNEGSTLASYTVYTPNTDEIALYKPYTSSLGYRLIQDNAFSIVNNSDLNNWNYIEPGQYVINSNAGAQSLSHCPTQYAFNMRVENAVSGSYGEEASSAKYRVRFITDILGNQYTQYVLKEGGSTSALNFGSWNKIITSADSVTELSSNGNITTSASWAYTGKSITIPSSGWWAIDAWGSYTNHAPVAIAIVRDVGTYYYELSYSEFHWNYDKTVSYLLTSCVGNFDSSSVIKLFAKYAGASTNDVGIRAKKLH